MKLYKPFNGEDEQNRIIIIVEKEPSEPTIEKEFYKIKEDWNVIDARVEILSALETNGI